MKALDKSVMCNTDVRLITRLWVLHISLNWLIPAFRDEMLALPVSISAMSDLSYGARSQSLRTQIPTPVRAIPVMNCNCSTSYHACVLRQLDGLCNARFHWIILDYKVVFPFSR